MNMSSEIPKKQAPARRSWIKLSMTLAVGLLLVGLGSVWFGEHVAADALIQSNTGGAQDGSVRGARPTSALASYALDKPDLKVALPHRLSEVSGLTDVSQTQVACVQDEEGVIFVYDLARRQVSKRVHFGPPGDYEGLSRVGNKYYVLRSDGWLYEVDGLRDKPKVRGHALSMLPKDNEGLGFDSSRQRLLVAPKSRWGKGKQYKDVRPIFAFDLGARVPVTDPVMLIKLSAIRNFAEAHHQPIPKKGKGGDNLKFRPASIAVHPRTKETFIVSAVDGVLAAFDEQGTPSGYALLNSNQFPQPEGITFLPNGDLVVTSEAKKDHSATLMVFKWRGATKERGAN